MSDLVGHQLRVKSIEPWFGLEESGVKPNTIRRMTDAELQQAHMAATIQVSNYERLNPRRFERTITGVYDVTGYIRPEGTDHAVLICWREDTE
jgi:hypothetical protein